MKKIKLFGKIDIDLVKLIATKLFIYANSGFGKSWLLRWFLEQTFGHIQQIVIDPEGEFYTLREKFDYVWIGKGKEYDIQADPRSAALLAHRLLEEKVSAIIDLYELEPVERERFVANFTTALVNVPKNLHHPYLYVVDEAQDFAPEKGDALSSKALHSIAKKGRKRGCCPIFATQRVSDFSKAVIAACNNKLIGQASLDIDMKRCAAELGFTTKEQMLSLRNLDPGEFFAFGPAITKVVTKVKIGPVQTTHPDSSKMGSKIGTKVVPASPKVKKALAALADLPQEAAQEATTIAELKAENATLKRENKEKDKHPLAMAVPDNRAIESAIKARDKEWAWKLNEAVGEVNRLSKIVQGIARLIPGGDSNAAVAPYVVQAPKIIIKPIPMPGRDESHHPPVKLPSVSDVPFEGISGPEQRILDAIALSESIGITEPEQTAVAFLAGYTFGGGGFNNPRGSLKTKGLVEYRGARIALTEAGRSFARSADAPLTREMMREKVMSILPGPEQKLLGPLMDAYPEAMTNEALAEASGYKNGSGGFNNPKGRLRSLGLIDYPSSGMARAKDLLFP